MAKPFRIPRKIAVITFEGTDFDGAEIRCRMDATLDLFMWFQRQAQVNLRDDPDAQEEVLRRFGDDIITEWNLVDDDGVAIPATGDGLMKAAPVSLAVMSFQKWIVATAEVPAPLVLPSPDGEPSAEQSTTPGDG